MNRFAFVRPSLSPAISFARLALAGVFALIVILMIAGYSFAQEAGGTTVAVGATLNDLLLGYVGVVGSVVAGFVMWVQFKIKEKTGLDIEFLHRDTVETFVTNAAGNFLARFDSLRGMTIDVKNPLIAELANQAISRIPDALAFFGLTPEVVKQRIVEKIGVLTAATPDSEPTPNAGDPVA